MAVLAGPLIRSLVACSISEGLGLIIGLKPPGTTAIQRGRDYGSFICFRARTRSQAARHRARQPLAETMAVLLGRQLKTQFISTLLGGFTRLTTWRTLYPRRSPLIVRIWSQFHRMALRSCYPFLFIGRAVLETTE